MNCQHLSRYFTSPNVSLSCDLFRKHCGRVNLNQNLIYLSNTIRHPLINRIKFLHTSSKDMSKPILYNYFRSSASWRVRIALAYKGIDYEYKPVNLLEKEQLDEEYAKVNPLGQVPAFVHNGNTITQSVAILEYLEELYPEKPLLPKDIVLKAKVREICEIIGAGIQPLQNLSVIMRIDSENASKRIEWAKFWIEKGFTALEKLLAQTSGKFCVGNDLTMADCFLVPQAAQATRFKVDISHYPNISRINETLKKLEPFKQADAFIQPDCPEELKTTQILD